MLIAPMAMQCMAHPDGELAVSRAAAAEGIPMVSNILPMCITNHATEMPHSSSMLME